MIATINTIFYVMSVTEESINSGAVQRGTAISRIDDDDGFQIYKFSNFITSPSDGDLDSNENLEVKPFEEENMYLITGKFSVLQDNSINVTIITSVQIPLDKDEIPTMKPTVHLLGKMMNYAQLSETGYTLEIQVKPYLSKEQFNPFLVTLTHPPNGRFKNALMKAKKNSTIHTTGLFFIANNKLYCEILEFQFIAGKTETESSISVPWKVKAETHAGPSSSKPKSAIERRIEAIRKSAPSPINLPVNSPAQGRKNKNKGGPFSLRISEISKSLQNQPIEIHDSDQEKGDDDEVMECEDEEEEEDEDAPISKRKSKRRKTKRN